MSLSEFYGDGRCGLSFELFPPKTPRGEVNLFDHVERLTKFSPDFITCTYGAGGSTREKTLGIIRQVKERFDIPVASHLTCVGATVEMLEQYLQEALSFTDFIVALRGDPPEGSDTFEQMEGGLGYANELVSLIRERFPTYGVAVAGYPEKHQEAPSPEVNLENLKRKVDCGADVVITQLFYDNRDFYNFRERYKAAGIKAPLIPGLLPVTNLAQIKRITSLCGARLPADFIAELGQKDDPQWQFDVGVAHATRQAQQLVDNGADGLHFYVLNKSEATGKLLEHVNLPRRS